MFNQHWCSRYRWYCVFFCRQYPPSKWA